MLGFGDELAVDGLVVIEKAEVRVVVLGRVDDALLQRLVEFAPGDLRRDRAGLLPEFGDDAGHLGADLHALEVVDRIDGFLAVVVPDARGPERGDPEAVLRLFVDDLRERLSDLAVDDLSPVVEALVEIEQREEVHFGDSDLGHEAGGCDDDVGRAELELLDEFVFVRADRSGVNVDRDFAAGDLLENFLELLHAVLVGVLLGRLVVRRHEFQRSRVAPCGNRLDGEDERKSRCEKQCRKFPHS